MDITPLPSFLFSFKFQYDNTLSNGVDVYLIALKNLNSNMIIL